MRIELSSLDLVPLFFRSSVKDSGFFRAFLIVWAPEKINISGDNRLRSLLDLSEKHKSQEFVV